MPRSAVTLFIQRSQTGYKGDFNLIKHLKDRNLAIIFIAFHERGQGEESFKFVYLKGKFCKCFPILLWLVQLQLFSANLGAMYWLFWTKIDYMIYNMLTAILDRSGS